MNGHVLLFRTARALAVILSLCADGPSALGMQANVVRTNLVERWITNLIEIRMPLNRFVNEYQTNWVAQCHTNVINVYATNRLTRTVTNQLVVDAFVTNLVTGYRTNWKTLDVTNWQTAIVMKTNWVTQVATNVVQLDLPSPAVAPAATAAAEAGEPKEVGAQVPPPTPNAALAGPVVLEAARTARPPSRDQVEVQLKVRVRGEAATALQVQKWRVEREDRTILCFGQDQEFKRELPAGRYKVEVKILQQEGGAVQSVKGTLVLTPDAAVIQQSLTAKK